MRAVRLARGLLLLVVLLLGTAALARRRPKSFVEPREMTEEQLEAAKERSKFKYNPWDKDAPQQTEPFPWLEVGLGIAAFLLAIPFAVRYFRSTADEIASSTGYPPRSRASDDFE